MASNNNLPGALVGLAVLAVAVAAIGGAWSTGGFGLLPTRAAAQVAADMSEEEFNRRVRDYILKNPKVIIEAVQRYEEEQQQAAQSAARGVIKKRADEIFRDPATPVGGNPQGDVTLVEFFDYNCPYCRRATPTLSAAIAADPQLRVVYKEFPILGPDSTYAAKAALAAHRQDKAKYLAFHDALMRHKGAISESAALAAAGKVGLDVERLKKDMEDPAITALIERNFALAQALNIEGTPGFVIGERIIPGAVDLDTLQDAIRQARETLQAKER